MVIVDCNLVPNDVATDELAPDEFAPIELTPGETDFNKLVAGGLGDGEVFVDDVVDVKNVNGDVNGDVNGELSGGKFVDASSSVSPTGTHARLLILIANRTLREEGGVGSTSSSSFSEPVSVSSLTERVKSGPKLLID